MRIEWGEVSTVDIQGDINPFWADVFSNCVPIRLTQGSEAEIVMVTKEAHHFAKSGNKPARSVIAKGIVEARRRIRAKLGSK